MKNLLLLFFCIISFNICLQAQACEDLPGKFDTYQAAITAIRSADFKYTDEMPEGSSPWIISAEYFSCDGNFGYFICSMGNGSVYIYESVPTTVWTEFKNADSKASFYEKHLKAKFKLTQSTSKE